MCTMCTLCTMCTGERRFERRGRAEVVFLRIHSFAFRHAIHDLRPGVAHAPVLDEDEYAVVGFDRVLRQQFQRAIGPHELPVRAAGHDAPFESGTRDRTAFDRNDSPQTMRALSDDQRGVDFDVGFEYEFGLQRRRGVGGHDGEARESGDQGYDKNLHHYALT